MKDVPSVELDELANYLMTANNELYRKIMKFFDIHGNLDDTEYNNMLNFLSKIDKWQLDRPMSETKSYFDEGLYTVCQFIQNAIQNITKVYPNILVNNADFFKNVPKHWGLSVPHQLDVAKFITNYYVKIERFKGDEVLMQLLVAVNERFTDLNAFVQNIPIHTEVVKEFFDKDTNVNETKTFHSIFDKSTTYLLFVQCFYSCIYEYISCSKDADLVRADIQSIKNDHREKIKYNANESNSLRAQLNEIEEDLVEPESELNEMQFVIGNQAELQKRTSSLLIAFLDVEVKNKASVDYSYAEIIQRVNRSKDKEKKGIIQKLERLSKMERSVEDTLKDYRLGKWNVGQQKGLVHYDPNTYDRERAELIQQIVEEDAAGISDNVNEMLLDVYELEKADNDELDEQYDNEAYGIDDLGENYNDGEYYEEDRDTNSFD